MAHGTGLTRGDRRRNQEIAGLREVVARDRAVLAIDLGEDKQVATLMDHDNVVLARKVVLVKVHNLGSLLVWAGQHAVRHGFVGVTVACEPTGHRWKALMGLADGAGMGFVCVQSLAVHRAREGDDKQLRCGGHGLGTWDVGPFDNDTAADWCGGLHDADPAQRVELIRAALAAVVDHGDGYLYSDLAVEAIAAAAIVASQLPGATPVTSPYAPSFLLMGGAVDVTADVPSLALRALDRITADNSEWRELWEEDPDSYAQAVAALLPVRTTLEQAST